MVVLTDRAPNRRRGAALRRRENGAKRIRVSAEGQVKNT
jgi:hypothetical protein